jgi:hypothetical protein
MNKRQKNKREKKVARRYEQVYDEMRIRHEKGSERWHKEAAELFNTIMYRIAYKAFGVDAEQTAEIDGAIPNQSGEK